MILEAFERAFFNARKKNWDKIYVAIDIHDTIVRGNYRTDVLPTEFYPFAKKVLQHLSSRQDIVLILNTCSWPEEIEKYINFFKVYGIDFLYTNENPEVPNTALGCYTTKFYFNVMIEDKAGFNAENEWEELYNYFKLDF
jgi:hypothetical protein